MNRIVTVYLSILTLVSFLLTISYKISVMFVYKKENLKDYFVNYIYIEYLWWIFLVVFFLSMVYLLISLKISNSRRIIKLLLYVVKGIILLFLIIMPLGVGSQVIGDYGIFRSGHFITEELFIESYELSDGIRLSKSTLPYKLKDNHMDVYYLFKKVSLNKKPYNITYFKNSKDDKIILAISK